MPRLLLASWGIHALESLIPNDLPRFNPIAISSGVLFFSASISLLTTLLFSLAPALFASKAALQDASILADSFAQAVDWILGRNDKRRGV